MLHCENWRSGKKNIRPVVLTAIIAVAAFANFACDEQETNPYNNLTLDAYSDMVRSEYVLSLSDIRQEIARLSAKDKDGSPVDRQVYSYYTEKRPLLWVSRMGVDVQADTLLYYIKEVGRMGFSRQAFYADAISREIDKVRSLHFDSLTPAHKVYAALEYMLTKAYLRYATGQRYGYINPTTVLNGLDPQNTDTLGRALSYRQLFDVDMEHPDRHWYDRALSAVPSDSVAELLHDVQPVDHLYKQLERELLLPSTGFSRQRLICNMERRRWRVMKHPSASEKHVIVNIPAYHLWAIGPDETVDMKIGCGTLKTKTPLLTSAIEYMQVNPEWNISFCAR